jgi:hypothetical protein
MQFFDNGVRCETADTDSSTSRKKAHYFLPGGEASPKIISFLGDSQTNVQKTTTYIELFHSLVLVTRNTIFR